VPRVLPDAATATNALVPAPDQLRAQAQDQLNAQVKAQTQDQVKAQRMANARAAKTAKQAQNQPAPKDVSGPLNGLDDPDDDPLGLNPSTASMSPAEALEEGLSLVRQAYYAGHTVEVKALQQEFNVATFKDVPVTAGHQLYASAMKMAQHVGMRP
jgi:hypothetical protein